MNVKKILCLLLSVTLILCFAACGEKKDDNTTSNTSSSVSLPTKTVTIGETTVKQIAEKLDKLELNDGLKLSITSDRSNEENATAIYEVVDSKDKKLATISIGSDLENKAANFSFMWNYADNDAELNKQILSCLKAILPAVWPEYSEENRQALERNFKLETDYIDRFVDVNTTEASPSTESSGFVSLGISSGTVIFSIRYSNIVEDV